MDTKGLGEARARLEPIPDRVPAQPVRYDHQGRTGAIWRHGRARHRPVRGEVIALVGFMVGDATNWGCCGRYGDCHGHTRQLREVHIIEPSAAHLELLVAHYCVAE